MEKIIAKKNPLFDKEFLKNLFSFRHREIYAKIILLTMKEEPLEQIEGKITDGSINIDGSSAVRRTCNLTLVAEDVNIDEFYWGLKNKFKLEIGIKNTIDKNYPEIIWFKQGIFVITQFNTTQDTKKWTIKIQGRDKMCLLNGDLSGQLPPGDFAVEQYQDEFGNITEKKIPIKTIILKLLQEFALELPHNIIINDVDEAGYDLLEYRGEEPFYLFKNVLSKETDNMSIDNNLECYYKLKDPLTQDEYNLIPDEYDFLKECYVKNSQNLYEFNELKANENQDYLNRIKDSNWFKGVITDTFNIVYDNLLDNNEFEGDKIPTEIRFLKGNQLTEDIWTVIKIDYGDIPGYRATELTFAGELKSNAGETITSILDKIKSKFTNFEYYYDIDGKFVFQKRKEYLLTPWNSVETEDNGLYTNAMINNSETLFTFTDSQLITSCQNTPNLQNLKNDYSVHGHRDNIALRMRYAIDKKPTEYTPIRVLKEKIVTIKRDSNTHKIIDEKIEYKYYDAPEQEPYEEDGLLSTDHSYEIIEFLDKKVNALTNSKIQFNSIEFKKIEKALNIDLIGKENYNWCLSLFSEKDNKNLRTWKGTFEDLKTIITILNNASSYYENPVQMSFIPTEDGYEIQTIIYPYFAKYSYSTSHVVLLKDEETKTEQILYKDKIEDGDNVIHYKVDWRELIYQMGLDYRKLNTTNNYYYYLTSRNNFVTYNKTGYEQYYVDLISNWRDLYDPNPKLQYDNSIKFNEIKKQSLLLDDIYIQNGYSLIDKDTDIDQSTLNYNNVYKFSHPNNSEVKSVYPFYQSDNCKLDEVNYEYYLKDEITKKMRNITKDEVYNTLKDVSHERIYVKLNNDYEIYAQVKFQDLLKKDNKEDNIENNNFYIQNSDYVKLSDRNSLYDLYYRSILYPLSFKASEILYELEEIVEDYLNYEQKPVAYIDLINNVFKKYFLSLNSYNYKDINDDINNFILTIIKKLFDAYSEGIREFGDSKTDFDSNYSCLQYIYSLLLTEYNKINKINSSLPAIEQLFNINNTINKLNICIQKTLRNIEINYNQVKFIIEDDILNEILFPEKDTEINSEYIKESIESLKERLESHIETLNNLESTESYEDGQAQITKKQLSNILDDIDNIEYNKLIERVKGIIEQIKQLNHQKNEINKFILHSFVWTEQKKEGHLLYTSLAFLKNIKNIFIKNGNEYEYNVEQIKDLLTYKNLNITLFEKSLNDSISNFENSTKDFQEYIILEDVNNFNEVRSNKIYYLPINYNKSYYNYNTNKEEGNYWYKDIFDNPQLLTFWFDFLEPFSTEMAKYAVPAIGMRSKVISDQEVKAVHYADIPAVIFQDPNNIIDSDMSGYTYINLTQNFMNLFTISTKGKTAKERIEELLYNHSYCSENINIQAIPIYNLEPNNKIYIQDDKCNINGEYLINKITIPLSFKKMMTITATKSISNII